MKLQKQSLNEEYFRWKLTQARLDLLKKHTSANHKLLYEGSNILERWLISTNNQGSIKDINDKMKKELIAKRIITAEKAQELMDQIIKLAVNKDIRANFQVSINNNIIKMGEYKKYISPDRLKLLRSFGGFDIDIHIAIASLRYSSMIGGGQQWAIPQSVYQILVKDYKTRIEGFASPFNSQILKFKDSYPNVTYCSLFPDTDTIFGSSGDFFKYDLSKKVSVINPPFIEMIIEKVVDKATETIKAVAKTPTDANSSVRLFIIVPKWEDASFYIKLKDNDYLETEIQLQKGKYYYENVGQEKEKVRATFDSTLFVLSYNLAKESYFNLIKAFEL